MTAGRSLKDSLFLGCREKRCCSHYTVFPTGADVWRIATALQVAPWSFTSPVAVEDEAPDGFALDDSGRRWRLALAKRPERDGRRSCTFLLRLNDGAARCGLGEGRPAPCHTFPAVMVEGLVMVRNDGGCSCRTWSLSDLDLERERDLLRAEAGEEARYRRVIANWNEFAGRQPPEEGIDYTDFCRFVLDMYAQLEQAEGPD